MRFSRIVFSLIFIFVTAACSAQSQSTQTVEAQPTQTSVSSPTNIPATATDQPQATPTSFPTYPPLPTLAPVIPDGDSSTYRLAPQTADQADEAITRIEQKIPLLEYEPLPSDAPGAMINYGIYYTAAWYAAWDALIYFPTDPRSQAWRWKMAYYMTLAGDGDDAAQIYMDQITTVLNSGQVNASDLENWFQSGQLEKTMYTPLFTLEQQPLIIPNIQDGHLITIGKLKDNPGGICLLVVKNAEKYVVYKVYNGFSPRGYELIFSNQIICSIKDVTDDGIPEIIVDQYRGGHNGMITVQIYSVTSLPPQVMPFTSLQEENLDVWNGYIQDYPISNNRTQIQVYIPVGEQNCNNYYTRYYQWNGKWFDLDHQDLHFEIPMSIGDQERFCTDMLLSGAYDLPKEDEIFFLDHAIQAYRPHAGTFADVLNQLITRKAISHAFDGNLEEARSTLVEITQTSALQDSIWAESAQIFLERYQQPADLYRACSAFISFIRRMEPDSFFSLITLCYSTNTIDYILTDIYPSIPLDQVTTTLKEIGVEIAAEGRFDFNQDGKQEYWFTLIRPEEIDDYQLWIVAESKDSSTFFVGYYETNSARPNFLTETVRGQIIVDYGGEDRFTVTNDPVTSEPEIDWISESNPDLLMDKEVQRAKQNAEKFSELRRQLFSNGNAASIYKQMLQIEEINSDVFHYTLALSAELAGEESDAIKRYYAIWKTYPESPFATLARLKLQERE